LPRVRVGALRHRNAWIDDGNQRVQPAKMWPMPADALATSLAPPPSSVSGTAPSLALLGMEPLRAVFEYARMRLSDRAVASLPQGDRHAVVVFPGLGGNAWSTRPMVEFCERLGYQAVDWGLGLNRGPVGDIDDWLQHLADHVDDLTAGHRKRISLIGWSLGGIYAREVAKKLPRRVRRVITLGTPFAGSPAQTHAGWVYQRLSGQPMAADDALLRRLRTPPAAPTTSIYSRSDGVVAWRACVNGDLPHVENVEVSGSHCGLGWNASAYAIIADRLARPAGAARSR
jgi:pimeloyl-ACP methyl ester carboxylesterase